MFLSLHGGLDNVSEIQAVEILSKHVVDLQDSINDLERDLEEFV